MLPNYKELVTAYQVGKRTRYKLKDGSYLSSPSRLLGILNPSGKEVMENIPYKIMTSLADKGKALEDAIVAYETVGADYTGEDVQVAKMYASFKKWREKRSMEFVGNDILLVDQENKLFGYMDLLYVNEKGYLMPVELKTVKLAPRPDHFTQCLYYNHIIETTTEYQTKPVLWVGSRDDGSFKEYPIKKDKKKISVGHKLAKLISKEAGK